MIPTRYAVAVHILLDIAARPPGEATSARIAANVRTNPVVIRRISSQLARAGLIRIRRGPGGATLAQPPEKVTLGDVWRAIHSAHEPVIRMHRPSADDPLGQRIPDVLGPVFQGAQAAMTLYLSSVTLSDLLADATDMAPEARAA